jgi:hypothetical protein
MGLFARVTRSSTVLLNEAQWHSLMNKANIPDNVNLQLFRVELGLRDILRSASTRDGWGHSPLVSTWQGKHVRHSKWSGIGTLVLCASGSQLLAGPHCAPVRSPPLQPRSSTKAVGGTKLSVISSSLPNCFDSDDEHCPMCAGCNLHEHDHRCSRRSPNQESQEQQHD